MHQIILYEDRNGISPVDEYLRELDLQNTKDARIRREKIRTYVKILKERGLPLPEPLCKHMVDKIYELRPIGDRVFFAGWIDGAYILLHCYKKSRAENTAAGNKESAGRICRFYEKVGEKWQRLTDSQSGMKNMIPPIFHLRKLRKAIWKPN